MPCELLFALQEAMTALQKAISALLAATWNALSQNAGLVVRLNASFPHSVLSSLAATRRAASARQRPTTAASETISRSAVCSQSRAGFAAEAARIARSGIRISYGVVTMPHR